MKCCSSVVIATTSRPWRSACRCRPCWPGLRASCPPGGWRTASWRFTFLWGRSRRCGRNTWPSTTPSGNAAPAPTSCCSSSDLWPLCLWSGLGGSWRTWTAWQVKINNNKNIKYFSFSQRRWNVSSSSSVLISYSHTYNPALKRSPLSIVTALVDKIGTSRRYRPSRCRFCRVGSDVWFSCCRHEAPRHLPRLRHQVHGSGDLGREVVHRGQDAHVTGQRPGSGLVLIRFSGLLL